MPPTPFFIRIPLSPYVLLQQAIRWRNFVSLFISLGKSCTSVSFRSKVSKFCSLPMDLGRLLTFVDLKLKYFNWNKFPKSSGTWFNQAAPSRSNTVKSLGFAKNLLRQRLGNSTEALKIYRDLMGDEYCSVIPCFVWRQGLQLMHLNIRTFPTIVGNIQVPSCDHYPTSHLVI